MKIGKASATTSVKVTPVKAKSQATTTESVDAGTKTKHSASPSSHMQLLTLAKQFVVDGALLSPDKQAPLEERMRKRERLLQLRKQQNLENIIQKAIPYCSSNEVTDRADQDWFNSFTALAEDISNNTMQELWAKILAGEIAAPGSFSLKSLSAFRNLSISEAKLLSKACALAVRDHSYRNMRIISGASQTPGLFNFFSKSREQHINLSQFGLAYSELLTLADNHLIFIQETETSPISKGESISLNYNGSPFTIVADKNNCLLRFYKFTPVGSELAQLIGDNANQKYFNSIKQAFSGLFSIKD
ncbi:TIGR03899 family protein [Thalassotalea sp. G2M2-11]|uniref:TIGR03899 family protein n=1 Tax=Thalassotalea sp. G2M2-11 TaxID=2787627 RepID=UPI0019D063E0|nr:TIGR03899 family protein [Thalassotalea sp. G2M2-11]